MTPWRSGGFYFGSELKLPTAFVNLCLNSFSITCIFFNSFAEDAILFQCHYSRNVTVDQEMTVAGSGVDDGTGDGTIVGLATGIGDFTYTMSISAGDLGGNTDVQITPNHNFENVIPRLVTSIY